jgi:hypothetical protein
MKVYYRHITPSTCFAHSCGHPQGGALKGCIEILQTFVNACTDVEY